MNNFAYYVDIVPIKKHIQDHLARTPNIVEVYRRIISMYVYTLHHAIKLKSLPAFAVSIYEKEVIDPHSPNAVRIQYKLRVFGKKEGAVVNLVHVLNKFNTFQKSSNISEVRLVSDDVSQWEIVQRVRIPPTTSGNEEALALAAAIRNDPNNNYINLLTSSSKAKNKRLIRYYYTRITVDRDNLTSKLDGYGFSRKNKKVCIPLF